MEKPDNKKFQTIESGKAIAEDGSSIDLYYNSANGKSKLITKDNEGNITGAKIGETTVTIGEIKGNTSVVQSTNEADNWITPPANYDLTYDVSENGDGSVNIYLVKGADN